MNGQLIIVFEHEPNSIQFIINFVSSFLLSINRFEHPSFSLIKSHKTIQLPLSSILLQLPPESIGDDLNGQQYTSLLSLHSIN